MKKRILLNYLPPAETEMPSPALSILKSFLSVNGFPVEIKYWNILMNTFLLGSVSDSTEAAQIRLLPFCSIISDKYGDTDATRRITANLRSYKPEWRLMGKEYYNEWLKETKEKIALVIKTELDKIDFNDILLIGFTSKFFQWIPGIILAEEIKKRNPGIKIIIGGFESRNGANEIMKICPHFDFASWGEGEYPLLELCKQLEKGANNFEAIPGLVYREKEQLKIATNSHRKYLDFDEYIFPDYDDFAHQSGSMPVRLPINSIRGCPWLKCRFCNYNSGYSYRERSPESILKEIKFMTEKYGADYFIFVDNDIIGRDFGRFNNLLTLLIEHGAIENREYSYWAQVIIHHKIDFETVKKLAAAGFRQIAGGYEAIADSILKKMNKSNHFAHNILFIKATQKFGINCPVNLIKGVPDESPNDVIESIDNLHFLRFFFSDSKYPLTHLIGFFNLKKEAKYFSDLTEDEIEKYSNNNIAVNLPGNLLTDRFNLFGYNKNAVENEKLWQYFINVEHHYRTTKYTYNLYENNGILYYQEYINDQPGSRILFDEPEYIDTLKFANDRVCSFDELFEVLQNTHAKITKDKLMEILNNLKEEYLLYYTEDLSGIVSVVCI